MFHRIRSVTALDDYMLRVEFCEGVTKVYDVKPMFNKIPIFSKLTKNDLFNKVKVDIGGYAVVWNKELDLECDELFYEGSIIRTRFDGLIAATDATVLWGLNESTLRKAISYGKLKNGIDVSKMGNQWIISVEAMVREYGEPKLYDEAIGKITERVRAQTTEFINDNMKEKAELSATLDKTNKKISDVKNDLDQKAQTQKNAEEAQKMQEGYAAIGKRRITDIQASRPRNILEQMIHNLSMSAFTNKDANQVFVEDSKLNMDKIVERCETLCTFFTAFDSIKLIDLNEEYISDILDSLKK